MTIFDLLRYPIGDCFTEAEWEAEWEQLPTEIKREINVRYANMPHTYPGRVAYIRMVREVIAEHNTK